MVCKFIAYESQEYLEMVNLRYRILREPLSLTFSKEDLLNDKNDFLIGCFKEKDDTLIGCCILTPNTEVTIQLRQMAVDSQYQHHNLGIGSKLIGFAEKFAQSKSYQYIYLHAREVALYFYKKHGYSVESDKFEEVGISHFEMLKKL